MIILGQLLRSMTDTWVLIKYINVEVMYIYITSRTVFLIIGI